MLVTCFERLNSGLQLYETVGRTGMLALCILVEHGISVLESL